jgi:hypothetical protein
MPGRPHRLRRHAEADESISSRITVMNGQRKGFSDGLPESMEAIIRAEKTRDGESYIAIGSRQISVA